MRALYSAELLKLRTVRSTWGFAIVAALLVGLVVAANIGGSSERDRRDPELLFRIALDVAFPAVILALLLGIILVTNEFRHGTIARTLLAVPRRGRLLVVKLLTGATAGAVLALASVGLAAATAAIWLAALGISFEFAEGADGAGRALVASVLAGLMGAALGAAVHSQVGALVGVLVWMFVLEPICWVVLGLVDLDGVAEYLPAAALGGAVDSEGGGPTWGASVGVAAAWCALAATVGYVRTRRRDIT